MLNAACYSKIAMLCFPIKHLEIRVTGNPGTRARLGASVPLVFYFIEKRSACVENSPNCHFTRHSRQRHRYQHNNSTPAQHRHYLHDRQQHHTTSQAICVSANTFHLTPRLCVRLFFALNRSFYPSISSTTSVRADSSIQEEIQVMWSQC